jgi:hypothetical protein
LCGCGSDKLLKRGGEFEGVAVDIDVTIERAAQFEPPVDRLEVFAAFWIGDQRRGGRGGCGRGGCLLRRFLGAPREAGRQRYEAPTEDGHDAHGNALSDFPGAGQAGFVTRR